MSIKDAWNEFMGPESGGYTLTDIPVPRHTPTSISDCRRICRQNVCHCYGVTWGCPPGVGDVPTCSAAVSTFRRCVMISRRFEIPIRDKTAVDSRSSEMQNTLRAFNAFLRSHGYRTLALADNGCNYCEKCSYPEPCTHPDELIPSMGGYGVMIVDHLENNGIQVPFEEDAFTVRCIVLYDDTEVH